MERDRKQAIEDTIFTAYSAAAAGYRIDLGMLSDTARRRIEKTLADLTAEQRAVLETETKYKERVKRLESLAKFSPKELEGIQQEMQRIAKTKHISLEKAYELHKKN